MKRFYLTIFFIVLVHFLSANEKELYFTYLEETFSLDSPISVLIEILGDPDEIMVFEGSSSEFDKLQYIYNDILKFSFYRNEETISYIEIYSPSITTEVGASVGMDVNALESLYQDHAFGFHGTYFAVDESIYRHDEDLCIYYGYTFMVDTDMNVTEIALNYLDF